MFISNNCLENCYFFVLPYLKEIAGENKKKQLPLNTNPKIYLEDVSITVQVLMSFSSPIVLDLLTFL